MARSSSVTGMSVLAHEALAGGAHERHRLGEQHAHRVTQRDRLLVDAADRLDLGERGGRQLYRRVQRQRRELLPLGLLHVLGLLLRELAQTAHELVRVAPERESESAAFHGSSVAARVQASGSLYRASICAASASTAGSACCMAAANGEPASSPRVCSSRREAAPSASR